VLDEFLNRLLKFDLKSSVGASLLAKELVLLRQQAGSYTQHSEISRFLTAC
jgi:hypothetical protein